MSGPDEPLHHILREAPPWDTVPMTACGRRENDVKTIVPFAEVAAFVKKHGIQRASFVHCMSCLDRVRYGRKTWAKDPLDVIADWVGRRYNARGAERERLERHVHALAGLVALHPEEYAALVDPTVPSLAEHRRTRGQQR